MNDHVPQPYQEYIGSKVDGPAGVRCSCGADFRLGGSYPDTAKGNESQRKIKTMRQAWTLYREHWGLQQ